MIFCIIADYFRGLVFKRRLDPYTQCQWFLQGLPETILMGMCYRYDIDVEDDDGVDFDDLLEKALVSHWL